MKETASKFQILLARLAVLLVIAFVILGIAWYGLSEGAFERFWRNLIERPGGPMTFRFILQPAMAALAALHDGLRDARTGRSFYLWTVLTSPTDRGGRLYEGLISTARIILLGLGMDTIYQAAVLGTFYPGEAAAIALALGFFPYVILRGPIARVARWHRGGDA